MIPTSLTLRLLLGWCAVAVAATFYPPALTAWGILGSGIAAVLVADLLLSLGTHRTEVVRQIAHNVALNVKTQGRLRVHNGSQRPCKVMVHESPPSTAEVEHLPQAVRVPAEGWAEVPYTLRATRRGELELGPLEYRLGSPFGFWWRSLRGEAARSLRVYPNFRAVARYTLLATANRTSQLGIRKRRRRGEGTEFHQLREYRAGDALRQIDWRATSRLRKMVSREYRDERDQQILFLLDCGRRMHARDGDLDHLDHALDAVLLLAYVALRQGDAVGLMTYGGVDRRLPPRKGASYLNTMLNAVFDLETTTAASDAGVAVEEALKTLRRRTLVVLVTNLRDEEDEDLIGALRIAARRHLVLLASLREAIMDETLQTRPLDFSRALRLAATHELLRARGEAHERLERTGLSALDVQPRELAASLVSRYLMIKASGIL
jgi:uncharacterized protein (DUF58 family)